ncbi:MAG TPA: diguanylate cyclase [Solirubrobacteraceae bacterium]|jgi:diguanylate cyclase (GGDEF)-like protein/putative nucleotidyltransferase with HDIG domain
MTAFGSEESVGVPGGLGSGASFEIRLMAKALAGLFAAGATLSLLTVLLPHPQRASVLGLLIIVVDAYVVAGVLFSRAARLPGWALPIALAWGSTLITGVAFFSGENPSPLVFFYLWIFLYSSYFFTKKESAVQIAYVGGAYGALLAARPPSSGIPAWWIVGMGTLLVAAILIQTMRERVELLIAQLYDAARTDPLTKLSNRRGFRELLDLELERARRGAAPMTVLMGDIDHLKEVNDRSGHHVGDAALQRVARLLEHGKRQIDGVARVGGEEFALILPDTDGQGAFMIAERLRCDLREEFSGDMVAITISFGVASYPQHGETAAALLRAADEALYAAKESGRNRTMLHSPFLPGKERAEGEPRDIEAERFIAVMLDLAEAVDLRFSGSARHSETVGRYAETMARELGLPERRVARVRLAGMLHDIGKVGVPDSILRKPGQLTDEELATIRRHPELGAQILEHPSFTDVRAWVGAHHERPDGRGYPLGLRSEAVPLEARILAVADAYEAMTSDRAYRSSIGQAAARAELQCCAGSQFDPLVVKAFLTCLERESDRADVMLSHA